MVPLVFILLHLSIVFASISFDGTAYRAFDVFGRQRLAWEPTAAVVTVVELTLRRPCTFDSPTLGNVSGTVLLLADWSTPTHYGCTSMVHLLERVSLLGRTDLILGVHGSDVDSMYDSSGPFSAVVYSNEEWPLETSAVAVDPLFVQAHRAKKQTTAVLTRGNNLPLLFNVVEDNAWSALVCSFSITFAVTFYRVAFSLAAFFGLYLVLRELHEHYHIQRTIVFKPHLAGIMGVLAIYSLVSWTIYLPYKAAPLWNYFPHYTGLLANTLSFCLMIQPSKLITLLQYFVVTCIVLATTVFNLAWIASVSIMSDGFMQYTSILVFCVLAPLLITVAFLFLILAVRLLMAFRAKSLPISRKSRQSLHRITLFGLAYWATFILYFIVPISILAKAKESPTRYAIVQYMTYSLWLLVNSVILWIWAARVFNSDAADPDVDDTRTEDRVELNGVEGIPDAPAIIPQDSDSTVVDRVDEEELEHAAKWNNIILTSNAHHHHWNSVSAADRTSLFLPAVQILTTRDAGLDDTFGSHVLL